jgi:LysM domain
MTMPGDTIQKIANERFNITVDSIMSFVAQTSYIAALRLGPYDALQTGKTVNIPVCSNTACTMTDFTFTYGTLQDFATEYNVFVGQLMSLNLGYNHTEAIAPLGVVVDCDVVD